MIPNSAADRAFLAEARDDQWAAWCEADVMRRIWGICAWSDTVIEEIACRSTMCRVTVNMPSPGVLASLYTNIALTHLYGDGVSGAEWNELPAPPRRYRAVFYLRYRTPLAVGRLAVGTDSEGAVDVVEPERSVSTGAGSAESIEALFEEIDAKLDELVAPVGAASEPAHTILPRRAVRAAGTGAHVARPRTLTPISAAAVSRAAEQIDIVEIAPSTVRSLR